MASNILHNIGNIMTYEGPKYRKLNTRERIISLIDSFEESYRAFEEKFDLKAGTVSEWKRGKMFNYMDFLPEIADEFNTTTDWLLGRVENDKPETVYAVVRGYLHENSPMEKCEHTLDHVEIPSDGIPDGELFAVKVAGDFLSPIALDGDYVVVLKYADKADDKLCVISIDGITTISKVKLDKESVTIVPINPMKKELKLQNQKALERGFFIEGTVYQIIRKFL